MRAAADDSAQRLWLTRFRAAVQLIHLAVRLILRTAGLWQKAAFGASVLASCASYAYVSSLSARVLNTRV